MQRSRTTKLATKSPKDIMDNTGVVTLSVIKSLNVIIITHRGEIATLSVIKYIFITLRGVIATLNVIKNIYYI